MEEIYYNNDGHIEPIPDWCSFLEDCGSNIAQYRVNGRLLIVVSVPTRAFVAGFLAHGLPPRKTTVS